MRIASGGSTSSPSPSKSPVSRTCQEFPTTPTGYRQALDFLSCHGEVTGVGIEGTSSYGVGITRTARAAGLDVVEVLRPEQSVRRRQGKSDPLDAYLLPSLLGINTIYGVTGIFTGAALVFFAYIGFDIVATTSEEARNPQRDIPIGVLGSQKQRVDHDRVAQLGAPGAQEDWARRRRSWPPTVRRSK